MERIFTGVRRILWNTSSLQDGMSDALAFATVRNNYQETPYLRQAAITPMPFDTIMDWVREGCAAFSPDPARKFAFIVLDCGDAPEAFRLQAWYLEGDDDLAEFPPMLKAHPLWSLDEIERHLAAKKVYIKKVGLLVDHNVSELQHPILSWNNAGGYDYHGASGLLLWLAVASLAWRECLRDAQFCRSVLKGCEKIILLAGYEEEVFYFGTVSQQGAQF
jgi:hypothetical protein